MRVVNKNNTVSYNKNNYNQDYNHKMNKTKHQVPPINFFKTIQMQKKYLQLICNQ